MTTTTTHKPSTEDISRYAYLLYERRGRQPGHEMEDWLEAEALLSAEKAGQTNHALSKPDKAANWQQPAKPAEMLATKRAKSF